MFNLEMFAIPSITAIGTPNFCIALWLSWIIFDFLWWLKFPRKIQCHNLWLVIHFENLQTKTVKFLHFSIRQCRVCYFRRRHASKTRRGLWPIASPPKMSWTRQALSPPFRTFSPKLVQSKLLEIAPESVALLTGSYLILQTFLLLGFADKILIEYVINERVAGEVRPQNFLYRNLPVSIRIREQKRNLEHAFVHLELFMWLFTLKIHY